MFAGTDKLIGQFHRHFRVVPAITPALVREAFRIRYQVYCTELHFEDPREHPDGLEHDAYDDLAVHALLLHSPSNEYVGCVRLILSDPGDPSARFPFERFLSPALRGEMNSGNAVARNVIGEISRLAVRGDYRRRIGEYLVPSGTIAQSARTSHQKLLEEHGRLFPFIAPTLYLTGAAMALQRGLTQAFVMMEPRLARHLRRYGILFQQVGDIVDYHGQRGPFRIRREDLVEHLKPRMRALLEVIGAELQTLRTGT
jgi:N-acyl amino acid synthase of PEP-CTERM/exosortase system